MDPGELALPLRDEGACREPREGLIRDLLLHLHGEQRRHSAHDVVIMNKSAWIRVRSDGFIYEQMAAHIEGRTKPASWHRRSRCPRSGGLPRSTVSGSAPPDVPPMFNASGGCRTRFAPRAPSSRHPRTWSRPTTSAARAAPYGLRPTTAMIPARSGFGPMSSGLSGRHSGVKTTPGSTMSKPVSNAANSSPLRR